MEVTPKYLVMVTSGNNNNKYYKMIPHGDSWIAEYGRIGYEPQKMTYSMNVWEKKYKEKIKKGYVDQSDLTEDLFSVPKNKPEAKWKPILNSSVAQIVERLQSMAKDAVQRNYNVSSKKVTQEMVNEAQNILNKMTVIHDINMFNQSLITLFTVIPRKMHDVKDYLASDIKKIPDIMKREQDLLDVMRGQVVQKVIEEDLNQEFYADKTILEAMGLEFHECSLMEKKKIQELLGINANKYYHAWKVINKETQRKFEQFVSHEHITNFKLLWHGSRNENWWSIINSGLVLKPTNAVITGKMFGYGIYFAPKAQKSLGYTSLSGSYWAKGNESSAFMALMNVAYGKPYDVYSFDSKYHSFNYEKLKEQDNEANCLHAHAGSMLRNDEIIIYKEEQCTVQYLVELR